MMSANDIGESGQDEVRDERVNGVSRRTLLLGVGGGAVAGAVGARAVFGASESPSPSPRSATVGGAPAGPAGTCSRTITEYELPRAEQTHEIVKVPKLPLLLISQMSNSVLVKVRIDPQTEEVVGVRGFALASPTAMLHGLAASTRYPGKIWATLEAENSLLLLDPGAGLDTAPKIVRRIDIPLPGNGPHYVGEYGDKLWVSLKDGRQVLGISHVNPKDDYKLYDALPNPIFVAVHPVSGEVYASQDQSSKILRIDPRTHATSQIAIPAERGSTPVGLVPGPGGVWFVLLGTMQQGTGTFGRIDRDGAIRWFELTSPAGRHAGLLHLAFDAPGAGRGAWLLGSSIISDNGLDAIVRVTFDDAYTKITSEYVAALPTQLCKAHRLLPLTKTLLATELTSSTVAQFVTDPGCRWSRPTTPQAMKPA